MAETILRATGIKHSYESDKPVLDGIDFNLSREQCVAIQGPSGVGKTTLLEILGTMRSPTDGRVEIMGENVYDNDQDKQARLRGKWLGFVFQESLLLPDLTVWQNCRLAVDLAGRNWDKSYVKERYKKLMKALGLDPGRRHDRPAQLSSGERQRVAVVRALIHEPLLVIADEPTGNLDEESSQKLLDLLLPLVRDHGTGIIVATHDPVMAQSIGDNYLLEQGKLKYRE